MGTSNASNAGELRHENRGLLRFLFGYFKPYMPHFALSLGGAMVFAVGNVMILIVFQIVLFDVIKTDQDILSLGSTDAEESSAAVGVPEEPEEPGPFDRLKELLPIDLDDLDLNEMVLDQYAALKVRHDIDDREVVYIVPAVLVLVIFLRAFAQFANGYFFQVIGLGATNDLRNNLYDRILHQSSRFFGKHPSGELVSRVGNDIAVMQSAVSTRFVDLFQQIPTLFILVWFLFSLNAKLALVSLVVVPAIAVPIVKFGKGLRSTSHKSQERLADLSNLVAEAVRGHRVVKAFGMEEFEKTRFQAATGRHLRVRLRAQLLTYASTPVIETLAALGAAAFLIYAGLSVREGTLKASELVTFLFAVYALYDPIRKLNKVNLVLQEALAAGQRVREVVEAPNDVVEREDAKVLATIDDAIVFDGVSFGYDEEQSVLREVDLRIPRGQVLAIVGPSGAGKSTLVNLLPRFFDPVSGAVRIDGVDVRDATLASLREQIGIVTQDTMLFNDTVRNNIAYGRADLPLDDVVAAAEAAHAIDFVEEMDEGWDTVIGEAGFRMSGGQRQRLAIARAVLKDPPILILDEATSHLDTEAEALVQQALYRLMEGRTALVIAHRLSTVQRADRIVVLEKGRIVEDGTHDELLALGGLYKRLYDRGFDD